MLPPQVSHSPEIINAQLGTFAPVCQMARGSPMEVSRTGFGHGV